VLLRLPLEIKTLFREWLTEEFPGRAARVISLLQSMHGGRDYTPEFGLRQRGKGPYATQIALRFRLAKQRLALGGEREALRTDLFEPPGDRGKQLKLL
jgi:DNA repair photolyase